MSILWTIIIGFVAGIIAKLIYPGNKYEPTGYIWTTVLGIIGAFVATYLGQAVGWYQAGEGAGDDAVVAQRGGDGDRNDDGGDGAEGGRRSQDRDNVSRRRGRSSP